MTGSRAAVVLQERDRRLLRALALFRVIDREQAKAVAGFHSTTRANTRLLALTRVGLLTRFTLGTFLGGRKHLYGLSAKGARLVDVPHQGLRWRSGAQLVANLFLEHQLRLNAILILLAHGAAPSGVRVSSVRSFREAVTPSVLLVPDAYLEMQTPGGIRPVFLEVDLGTETRKAWMKKVDAYLRLAMSGDFARHFHHPQFRVLVVTTTVARLHAIRRVMAQRTDKVFYLTTFNGTTSPNIWSRIWLRPTGHDLHSLL